MSRPPEIHESLPPGEQRFERVRRRVGFWLAPAAFAATWVLTTPHLAPEASRLSAVMALMVVFWVTESIPLPATALLGAALNILLGVADARTVLAPFGDPIIFIFIGGFILAQAMQKHGLDQRLALGVLRLPGVGQSPARILAAFGLVTGFVSMWMSNTATTAIFLPIALGVLGSLAGGRSFRGQPYATGFMLMLAYAASLGGIVTPVGSPPNLIGIGQLEKLSGISVGFLTWVAVCLPIFAVMFAGLWVLLWRLHPARGDFTASPGNLAAYLAERRRVLGRWTPGEASAAFAFAFAVTLWLAPGLAQMALGKADPLVVLLNRHLPESIVALLAALLLFFLPGRSGERAISWDDAVRIDWGVILLFGGGLSLGGLMFSTGVAKHLGEVAAAALGPGAGLWLLTALAIVLGIALSEATSNTSSATMLCPVVIALAEAMGVNPVAPTLGACLGASMGFMLPVSTPPNAIAYGSGHVPLPAMLRAGFLLDVMAFVVIFAGLRVLCPLLGLA